MIKCIIIGRMGGRARSSGGLRRPPGGLVWGSAAARRAGLGVWGDLAGCPAGLRRPPGGLVRGSAAAPRRVSPSDLRRENRKPQSLENLKPLESAILA